MYRMYVKVIKAMIHKIYNESNYIAPSLVANVERYIRSTPVYILIVITHPDNGLQVFLINNGL